MEHHERGNALDLIPGRHLGLLVAVSSLLELLFGPIWGSISDRTGRKPIFLLGLLGYALSSLLFGLSTELWMLFASRGLSGLLSSAALSQFVQVRGTHARLVVALGFRLRSTLHCQRRQHRNSNAGQRVPRHREPVRAR